MCISNVYGVSTPINSAHNFGGGVQSLGVQIVFVHVCKMCAGVPDKINYGFICTSHIGQVFISR